ncbi:hypothetical protein [Methanobacterium sp.]|uniref:hypothetical protein n=1 Tax=Methanobacterium sp. TaxID=2164 RepID=UPI003C71A871
MNSEKILGVKLSINILKIMNVISKDYVFYKPLYLNSVDVTVTFDKCGIGSARFDFNISKSVDAPELINALIITCTLADEILFEHLKNDLMENTSLSVDVLEKHMTYSVISSNSINNSPKLVRMDNKEIFGISWKYHEYMYAEDNMIQEIIKNSIPVQEGDIFTITTQSTLMIFPGVDDEYIEERIMAIEMFWIQKLLLKKIDFQLGCIFEYINKDIMKGNLKAAIQKIRNTKIRLQSDLDVYRNTIVSVTHSFLLLFETLNIVFDLNKHYNFVQEKMNSCENIYQGLYSEEQNVLTENIQWIVIIIGSFTLILPMVTDIIYTKDLTFNQARNAGIVVIIFSVILIILLRIILSIWMKRNLKSKKEV